MPLPLAVFSILALTSFAAISLLRPHPCLLYLDHFLGLVLMFASDDCPCFELSLFCVFLGLGREVDPMSVLEECLLLGSGLDGISNFLLQRLD